MSTRRNILTHWTAQQTCKSTVEYENMIKSPAKKNHVAARTRPSGRVSVFRTLIALLILCFAIYAPVAECIHPGIIEEKLIIIILFYFY